MFLLDDILLLPMKLPVKGFEWIMKQIQTMADEELLNDQPWKERLIELQMMLELGEISEAEYGEQEAQVFQALRDVAIAFVREDERVAVPFEMFGTRCAQVQTAARAGQIGIQIEGRAGRREQDPDRILRFRQHGPTLLVPSFPSLTTFPHHPPSNTSASARATTIVGRSRLATGWPGVHSGGIDLPVRPGSGRPGRR